MSSTSGGGKKSFHTIRKQLDDLGFYQPLLPESLPLVESILYEFLKNKSELSQQKKKANLKHSDEYKEEKENNHQTPKLVAKSELNRQNFQVLERKVLDLELLNAQATSLINRLQEESMEKSKKIMKLQSGVNRAKVVTKSSDILKPKIELSSLVKPTARKAKPYYNPGNLDLVAMYERRNKQLDHELTRLQKRLKDTQDALKNVDLEMEKRYLTSDTENIKQRNTCKDQSSYMFKLIRENEKLKEELNNLTYSNSIVRKEKFVLRSRSQPGFDRSHYEPNLHKSCEDIRSQVEKSHMMMHNLCLKNQVEHLQDEQLCFEDLHKNNKQIQAQQEHIEDIQEQIRYVSNENKTLKRRVDELSEIRDKQKDKIDDLQRRQNILLKSKTSDHSKVEELIDYMEQQRNIYKNGVEKLIDRLDPNRKIVNGMEITDEKLSKSVENRKSNGISDNLRILKEIQNNSRKVIQDFEKSKPSSSFNSSNKSSLIQELSYRPSPYKDNERIQDVTDGKLFERLNTKLKDIEDEKLFSENNLNEKIKIMKEEIKRQVTEIETLKKENSKLVQDCHLWKTKYQDIEKYNTDEIDVAKPNKDDSILNVLNERLASQEAYISKLKEDLTLKQNHLLKLSNDKDELQDLLDEKTRDCLSSKNNQEDISSDLSRTKADLVLNSEKLKQTLQQNEKLHNELQETKNLLEKQKENYVAERAVATEFRNDNIRIKEDLRLKAEEKKQYYVEIEELKKHIQKYVNEVKRIEELLAFREQERTELLTQYKQLSIEISTAENYGRKMEAQVESLKVQISAKESELSATLKRLADLERDMVELSLNNENYRAKVANLSAQVDKANLDLREAQSQSSWINTDLANIHEMAIQLSEQKTELQNQLAEQNKEIESLNEEIKGLRSEVNSLTGQVKNEQEKNRHLEERYGQYSSRER